MDSSVYGANAPDMFHSKTTMVTGRGRKGGNNILIKKLFYRQIGSQKQNEDGISRKLDEDTCSRPELSNLYRDLQITPCPYIRPAGFKLEPRIEFYPSRRRAQKPQPPVTVVVDSTGSSVQLTNLRVGRLREDIVLAAAADPTHMRAWTKYLKCYAEGRFSLMMPPDPPPMKSSFTYLPAIFPINEAERLAILETCNTEWSDWAVERARALVCDAMQKFKAPWAAISIFDRDLEIVKAECGYHRQFVRRQESIAAHVLLSNDLMFIPDTQKDWRFAGNPLVIGDPNIRFFAGAPLLTANGQVIGVFSVFGPEPRDRFNVMERRELTDLAGMAMSDLTFLMDNHNDESQRGTPILQRTELINQVSPPEQLYSPRQRKAPSRHESKSAPPGLRYHRAAAIRRSKPRLVIDGQRKEVLGTTSEHTPPTSDDSDEGSTRTRIKGFGKNFKELTVDPKANGSLQNELLTPDSSSFPLLLPRAFSGSDLTSVEHNQHCVTPEIWCDESADLRVLKSDEIVEHTLTQSLSAFDKQYPDSPTIRGVHVVGDAGSPSISLHSRELNSVAKPPHSSASHLSTISTDLDLNNRRSLDDTPTSGLESSSVISKSTAVSCPDDHDCSVDQSCTNPATSIQSNSSNDLICQDLHTKNTQVEADFAADFAARNLGFDCVYAASFTPPRPFMTDAQLVADGGMIVRILASYGLPDDVGLNVPLHLSIIRGQGMKFWEDDKSLPGECGKGFMMRLKSSGGPQSRSSEGVVFGAFRNTPSSGEPLPRVSISEFQRLRDAALALKSILFKNQVASHTRSHSELPKPTQTFSAVDANGTGKFSLDAGISRLAIATAEPNHD